MGTVTVGVDVGQKRDPSAIAVVERVESEDPTGADVAGDRLVVRRLERLPLNTPYQQVADRVAEVMAALRKRGHHAQVYLDVTGVGMPISDLLRARGVRACAAYFTSGDKLTKNPETGHITLGKGFLVARLQVLLQGNHFRLPRTAEAEALAKELLDYEIHISEKGDDTFGAFKVGTHDDLVTALGLAVVNTPPVISVATAVPPPMNAQEGRSLGEAMVLQRYQQAVRARAETARAEAARAAGEEQTTDEDDGGDIGVAVAGGVRAQGSALDRLRQAWPRHLG